MSSMHVRDRPQTSPGVPSSQQPYWFKAVQVRQVHVQVFQSINAQQSRQVAHERLPIQVQRLLIRSQVLPCTQGISHLAHAWL